MENTLIVLYLLVAVGLVWYLARKPKKKIKNTKLEDLVLRQAKDLDEAKEILIKFYEKKYWEKKELETKTSEVVDTTRSESKESGIKE